MLPEAVMQAAVTVWVLGLGSQGALLRHPFGLPDGRAVEVRTDV